MPCVMYFLIVPVLGGLPSLSARLSHSWRMVSAASYGLLQSVSVYMQARAAMIAACVFSARPISGQFQAIASIPLFLTIVSSFNAVPLGFLVPRSHAETWFLLIFRYTAKAACDRASRSRMAWIVRYCAQTPVLHAAGRVGWLRVWAGYTAAICGRGLLP